MAIAGRYDSLTAAQAEFYQAILLKEFLSKNKLIHFARKIELPLNSGATTSVRRYTLDDISTTPIAEGASPNATPIGVVKVSMTAKKYGGWSDFTEEFNDFALDKKIPIYVRKYGQQTARAVEKVGFATMIAGTNVVYGGGRTATNQITASDKFSYALASKIATWFRDNDMEPVPLPAALVGEGMEGAEAFICFVTPKVGSQIRATTEWRQQHQFHKPELIAKGIIGMIDGVFFIETTNVPVTTDGSASQKVAKCVAIAEEAFAMLDVMGGAGGEEGAKADIIVKDPSLAGGPLNEKSTIGAKIFTDFARTNEKAVLRIEVAEVDAA